MIRPAGIAIDSGLSGESPEAIASALTYSYTPNTFGRRLSATVVLLEPFAPPIT